MDEKKFDICLYFKERNKCSEQCRIIGRPCNAYINYLKSKIRGCGTYKIRDDQIRNLRAVAEKLKGLHDGASVIITATLDAVETNLCYE